ncbi:MAG: hypothetical protein ACI4AD_06135 [Roseburia sp.]
MPNIVLLLAGLILFCAFLVIFRRTREKLEALFSEKKWLIFVLSAVLLVVQVLICYNAYFITGWDSSKLLNNAFSISTGQYQNIDNVYFSRYTNNTVLLFIFTVITSISLRIGASSIVGAALLIAVFQCALSTATAYLLFRIVADYTKSYGIAFWTWIFYVLFIGVSPWLFIPYSDSTGLIFPILILRLYQLTGNERYVGVKWFFIGLATFFGFKIKPQTAIVFIAIVLVELVCLLRKENRFRKIKEFLVHAMAILLAVALGTLIYRSIIFPATHISLNENGKFGVSYFLMLGLNEETNGCYSADDVGFAMRIETVEERTDAVLEEAKNRLKNLGASGLTLHLIKKALVNFSDGTFAWGEEGGFYNLLLPDRAGGFSPLLKNIYYEDGSFYSAYTALMQMFWLTILFFMLGLVIGFRHELDKNIIVIILAILGLALFELIFEARARYLFVYAPFFIILAMVGAQRMIGCLPRKCREKTM